jgi:hypothetical protein
MGWLASVFSRGDEAAATNAIAASIAADVLPNFASISEETGVSGKRLQKLVHPLTIENINRRVGEGIAAGAVPTQAVYEQAMRFGLSADEAKVAIENVVSDHFTKLVVEILEDGQVEPSEDLRPEQFMAMIGQSVISPKTDELLEAGRQLYLACNAPLEPAYAPVLLKKGEYCVHVAAAEALEDRSRTVRLGYHGPVARIPLWHGLSYRIGSVQAVRQTERYQHSFGVGALCMTNKRFLWIGTEKSISISLSNIVRFDPYTDGINIFKGTGKPLLFRWCEDRSIAIFAQRTINELRD